MLSFISRNFRYSNSLYGDLYIKLIMNPKPKDIKVYGSIFTMSGDGQAAYA